jgi:Zn ribbon nucleic-acid-binding protein
MAVGTSGYCLWNRTMPHLLSAAPAGAERVKLMVAAPIVPKNKVCPRCRAQVKSPLWSESEQNWIHFVWHCVPCGHHFKTTAIYDLLQLSWLEQPAKVAEESRT